MNTWEPRRGASPGQAPCSRRFRRSQPRPRKTHLHDLVIRLSADGTGGLEDIPGVVGATCLYTVYDPVSRTCPRPVPAVPLPTW
jgi:hypothetical protein